ncbi:NADP-specific glutamate dehydrogenase [hydrothermal vent metagenome]|uniref:NADP-specific glutamate dehydrogenase n=1 Tax=hydrothermal vent metagenome TaxID=652676 RepID=A0A3B1E9H0_9ZZZZ
MSISDQAIEKIKKSNCTTDTTFFQAVEEVLDSLKPVLDSDSIYKRYSIIDRLTTPDREFKFKIVWMSDNQEICVNTGYRVQFNNALGPYKGGLRFHPSVNNGILKFLGFEQILKNSLTGLPLGGAKGGSDFDPKGKSDFEIMKFCNAYMTELHKYIGPRIDVPAGDIGVGAREIGYLFGAYKKITSSYEGVLTGKPYMFGGSLIRPEATGYGCVYFTDEMLKYAGIDGFKDRICTVSGAGNVAIHTIEKLYDLGAKPVSCTDSKGTIYDPRGIDLELLKELKLKKRVSLLEYCNKHSNAIYTKVEDYPKDAHAVWQIPCDCAFPCATQNELTHIDAANLIENGTISVSEGANMPSTPEAIELFKNNDILFAPAKAANAGGVAVSGFEMSQNASMAKWTYEDLNKLLEKTMRQICKRVHLTAKEYGVCGNYVDGANIAGFKKVADAMIAEGI